MEKKCCANRSCGSALLLGSAVLFQNMLAEWNQKLLHIIYLNTCMCEQELCLQDREVQHSQSAWCSCYFTWYDIIFILWASIWNCWCHKVCHDTYWLDSIDDRWSHMPRSFHKTITQWQFLMNHHQYVGLWRPHIASSVQTKTLRLLILMTKQSSKWVKRSIEFIIYLLSEHS